MHLILSKHKSRFTFKVLTVVPLLPYGRSHVSGLCLVVAAVWIGWMATSLVYCALQRATTNKLKGTFPCIDKV